MSRQTFHKHITRTRGQSRMMGILSASLMALLLVAIVLLRHRL